MYHEAKVWRRVWSVTSFPNPAPSRAFANEVATLATLLTPLLAQGRLRLLYLALRLLLMPTFRTPKYALFAIFSDTDNSRPFLA
jgi:hypothetical protein